jgi:hypothetical protein
MLENRALKNAIAFTARHWQAIVARRSARAMGLSMNSYESIYSRDNPEGEAHGWIQWKGTNVCIDLHCKCGAHMHFDGDFLYHFSCPHCGRKYALGQNVALIELTEDEAEANRTGCWQVVEPDEDKPLLQK